MKITMITSSPFGFRDEIIKWLDRNATEKRSQARALAVTQKAKADYNSKAESYEYASKFMSEIDLKNQDARELEPNRNWLIQYGGGQGDQLWEKAMIVTARTLGEAYEVALPNILSVNGYITGIDLED